MKSMKVWASFIAVFVSGAVVGVLGLGLVLQHHFAPPKDKANFHLRMRDHALNEIRKEVGPDPAAMPYIKEILTTMTKELDNIRKETHPRIKDVFKRSQIKIKEHLTLDQASRFDEMIRKRREGRGGLFRLPPPPPPMP